MGMCGDKTKKKVVKTLVGIIQ